MGDDLAAGRCDQWKHGWQIALALAVVAPHTAKRRGERCWIENVDAAVDLADQKFFGGCVAVGLGLNDLFKRSVGAAHNTPVAARVVE